jgi:THO complex subunit 3
MALFSPHDLHDTALIQADRLISRYGTTPNATALAGHPVRTLCVDWNCNGEILASSAEDGTVHLWSLQDERRIAQSGFAKHSTAVNRVAWSPVENYALGTVSGDQGVLLWDHRDSGVSPTAVFAPVKGTSEPIGFDFSGDGSKVAVVTSVGRHSSQLIIYDVKFSSPLCPPIDIPYNVTSFAWIHSSNLLLAGSSTGHFWACSASSILELDPSSSANRANPLSETPQIPFMTIAAHTAAILTIQAEKNLVVSGGSDSMIFFWDAQSLACLKSLSHADNSVRAATISPDQQIIAAAYEKDIALYASNSIKLVGSIPNPSWTVSWHPWRSIVAFGGESNKPVAGKYPGNLLFVNYDS